MATTLSNHRRRRAAIQRVGCIARDGNYSTVSRLIFLWRFASERVSSLMPKILQRESTIEWFIRRFEFDLPSDSTKPMT